MAVLETKKPSLQPLMTCHLKEVMVDVELYSWKPIHAYHACTLSGSMQQIENGHVKWYATEAKLQFHHTLVWHPATTLAEVKAPANASPSKKASNEGASTNISAKPGM